MIQDISLTIKKNNDEITPDYSSNYHLEIWEHKKTGHLSSDYISLLFLYGNAKIKVAHKVLTCHAGNVIMIRENTTLYIDKEEKGTLYILHFKKLFFNHYVLSQIADCPIFYDMLNLTTPENEYLFFDCMQNSMIDMYKQIILYESSLPPSKDEKMIRCSFILFLTNLHRIHHKNLVISDSSMMPNYSIGNFLKYMTEHYTDVTLVSMAEHFNFHPSYFSTLFKTLSGYTFSEKLLMIKLEHAKRLLLTTDLNISEIVELIGFREKSYFHKCFKKYYHETPAKYRKNRGST